MNVPKMTLSVFIVFISGFALIGFQNSDLQYEQVEVDDFIIPENASWGGYGEHDNTYTDADNNLIIDETNEEVGHFYGDRVEFDGDININRVVVETDSIDQKHSANFTINLVDKNDTVYDSQTVDLEQGRVSSSFENLSTEETKYLDFEFGLSTTDSSSPEIQYLDIEVEEHIIKGGEFSEILPNFIFITFGILGLAGIFSSF
ncbi:MAG: hypothetical protein ACLFVB_10680 [Thermoplasmata archaeon]